MVQHLLSNKCYTRLNCAVSLALALYHNNSLDLTLWDVKEPQVITGEGGIHESLP